MAVSNYGQASGWYPGYNESVLNKGWPTFMISEKKVGRLLLERYNEQHGHNSLSWLVEPCGQPSGLYSLRICDAECGLADLNVELGLSLALVTAACHTKPLPRATLTMELTAIEAFSASVSATATARR